MLTNIFSSLARKSNDELLADVARLVRSEREATAGVVAHLAEIDARKLFLSDGFNSLFVYCVEKLGFSEEAAYSRIKVARAARLFPAILEMLGAGSVNLTTVRLLAPHLTEENHRSVLESAKGKRRQEVEQIVARLSPKPDVPTSIRKLPAPKAATLPAVETTTEPSQAADVPAPSPAPPAHVPQSPPLPGRVVALAPQRFKLQLTVGEVTVERLRLAQDMLRHAIPSGDEAEIIDRALILLLEDLARKKFAETDRPRPAREARSGSRYIPASIKRAVWLRDLGRCAFVGPSGHRCGSRAYLEFHHLVPYAAGGETTVENLRLECAAHNRHEAELFFGSSKWMRGEIVRESDAAYRWKATGSGTSCPSRAAPP